MRKASMYGRTLIVPAWYKDNTSTHTVFFCEHCQADSNPNPMAPWCPVCEHAVRKYQIADRGKRFGTHFCDVVAKCHGKVDVLKIEWDHEGIDMNDPALDEDLAKRINSLTFFLDTYGDGNTSRTFGGIGSPTVDD